MRRVLLPGVAAVLLLHGPGWAGQDAKWTGPIAVSGGTEVHDINITREKVAYASKKADLTHMTVGLWFTAKWKKGDGFYFRLSGLSPVADDTGKVLSTERRLAEVEALQGEVRSDTTESNGGRWGPVLRVVLDVPARRAKAIKAIKGKAEVCSAKLETVKFDLEKVKGKPLSHPHLKGLKITPSVTAEKGGDTDVTLRVPATHDRLVSWGVEAGGRPLRYSLLGEFTAGDGVNLSQTFPGELPKGCSLVVQVAVTVETKSFEFDFKDVELP
jgi:hypothetical protein